MTCEFDGTRRMTASLRGQRPNTDNGNDDDENADEFGADSNEAPETHSNEDDQEIHLHHVS